MPKIRRGLRFAEESLDVSGDFRPLGSRLTPFHDLSFVVKQPGVTSPSNSFAATWRLGVGSLAASGCSSIASGAVLR
ncbi:MAG: hypothetical protein U0744_09485 [Gemmataceae bacterium]